MVHVISRLDHTVGLMPVFVAKTTAIYSLRMGLHTSSTAAPPCWFPKSDVLTTVNYACIVFV